MIAGRWGTAVCMNYTTWDRVRHTRNLRQTCASHANVDHALLHTALLAGSICTFYGDIISSLLLPAPGAVVAVLAHCDCLLLGARVLAARGVMGGLLHHLASDPPYIAVKVRVRGQRHAHISLHYMRVSEQGRVPAAFHPYLLLAPACAHSARLALVHKLVSALRVHPQVLQVLADRVLGPSSSIPPAARADLFGDLALQQLAELATASQSDQEAGQQPGHEGEAGAEGSGLGPSSVSLAATAACETLISLFTDPSQGLVSEPGLLDAPLPAGAGSSSRTGGAGKASAAAEPMAGGGSSGGGVAGVKRILRLLPRLQPASAPRHVRVLEALAVSQPALAAEYLSGGPPLVLEPKVRSSGCLNFMTMDLIAWRFLATCQPQSSRHGTR